MKKLLFAVFFFTAGIFNGFSINIGGYWENWAAAINPQSKDTSKPEYYHNDIKYFTNNYYSFLTLVEKPDPGTPPVQRWDGKAIYESMTQADVIKVMTETNPPWENPYNWQRVKIAALQKACHNNGAKFIWAIGGWSDLTQTITDEQVPVFVQKCVDLLKLSGDGIDFDWEHLSEDSVIKDQQRHVLGKVLAALRKALNDSGMADKQIGYTTRFNAFWNPPPAGVEKFPSDGEGVNVFDTIKSLGYKPESVLNWVNIMMYDVAPSAFHKESNIWALADYQLVLEAFSKHVPANMIIMGFEPGPQPAGGIWSGMSLSKEVIQYIKNKQFGGIMFWAINEHAKASNDKMNGENSQSLAGYAKSLNYKK